MANQIPWIALYNDPVLIIIDSLFMFVQLAVVEQLNLLISLSGKYENQYN